MEKANSLVCFICLCCAVILAVHSSNSSATARKQSIQVLKEDKRYTQKSEYIKQYCSGTQMFSLSDNTKIECVTKEHAIAVEWAKNWTNGIGKCLFAAQELGKKPAIALILQSENDEIYTKNIAKTAPQIKVFTIKTYLDENAN